MVYINKQLIYYYFKALSIKCSIPTIHNGEVSLILLIFSKNKKYINLLPNKFKPSLNQV